MSVQEADPLADPDRFNINFEGLGPPDDLDHGTMGISMTTAGLIVVSIGIFALLLLPMTMCYMALTTRSECRRWRREEMAKVEHMHTLERSLDAWYREREHAHAAARAEIRRLAAEGARAIALETDAGSRSSSARHGEAEALLGRQYQSSRHQAQPSHRSDSHTPDPSAHHRTEPYQIPELIHPSAHGQQDRRDSHGDREHRPEPRLHGRPLL